jgi:hypothetical protein
MASVSPLPWWGAARLYGSYAQGRALGPPQARAGMVDLVRSHWGLGSRLLADLFGPS